MATDPVTGKRVVLAPKRPYREESGMAIYIFDAGEWHWLMSFTNNGAAQRYLTALAASGLVVKAFATRSF